MACYGKDIQDAFSRLPALALSPQVGSVETLAAGHQVGAEREIEGPGGEKKQEADEPHLVEVEQAGPIGESLF